MSHGDSTARAAGWFLGWVGSLALLSIGAVDPAANRLLTREEMSIIEAADGALLVDCFKIQDFNCTAIDVSGNHTGCGTGVSGNCTGSCKDGCSASGLASWQCVAAAKGNLAKCPTMSPIQGSSCGNQIDNGICTSISNGSDVPGAGCYCLAIQRSSPVVPCGKRNAEPNGPFTPCSGAPED